MARTIPAERVPRQATTGRLRLTIQRREAIAGILFAAPAMLGFLFWWLGPIVIAAFLSLTDWNILGTPQWVGLDNYFGTISASHPEPGLIYDPLFWKSVQVTVTYAIMAIPTSLFVAFLIALALSQPLRHVGTFRTIYYLPAMLPSTASALMWLWLYNPEFGFFDSILRQLHLPTSSFVTSESSVLPSLAVITIWASGSSMIVFLAALQGVPNSLYEAAAIDGAGALRRIWHITLPVISPVILFNFITAILGTFASGIVWGQFMTNGGGPNNASLFYGLYLYRTAFQDGHMGYAMAMGWVMFVVLAVFTLITVRISRSYVYYEEAGA